MSDANHPWYEKGLHFSCKQCGMCCSGTPGYVFLSKKEALLIAEFLKISGEDFYQKYVRTLADGRISLKEISPSYRCIFLKDHLCLIYPVRPTQCRTFPWWKSLLSSEKAWKEEKTRCPGIDQGPLHPYEKIQKELDSAQEA